MIEIITSKTRPTANVHLFHDSRSDIVILAKQMNLLTDKINEIIECVDRMENIK